MEDKQSKTISLFNLSKNPVLDLLERTFIIKYIDVNKCLEEIHQIYYRRIRNGMTDAGYGIDEQGHDMDKMQAIIYMNITLIETNKQNKEK